MSNLTIEDTESYLRQLAAELTDPREGECLLCYVYRMLEHGCRGLRWASRYRDQRAPRATALERRLGQVGGFCDCEIFVNGYDLRRQYLGEPGGYAVINGVLCRERPYPNPMPSCLGVGRGSTRPCGLWTRRPRGGGPVF